ncbi:hypothetical protein [Paenibacillus selenitireducens]|nr:hypothetical protein [Paenibacillus selenitireducens]
MKKILIYTYEVLRSIVFLAIGLLTLNFIQQKIIRYVDNIWLMILVLIGDLMILSVIYNQFISKQKLSSAVRTIMIFAALSLIISANILGGIYN